MIDNAVYSGGFVENKKESSIKNLFHINVHKNYEIESDVDQKLYDYHQRKSKEIRRL
jgi:hypothetical protein